MGWHFLGTAGHFLLLGWGMLRLPQVPSVASTISCFARGAKLTVLGSAFCCHLVATEPLASWFTCRNGANKCPDMTSHRILVNNTNRGFINSCHWLRRRSCIGIKSRNRSIWRHTRLDSPCPIRPGNACCHEQATQTPACSPFYWKPVFSTCYNYSTLSLCMVRTALPAITPIVAN